MYKQKCVTDQTWHPLNWCPLFYRLIATEGPQRSCNASASFCGGPGVRRQGLERAVRSLVCQFRDCTSSPQLPLNSFSFLSNSLHEPRTFSWLSTLETTVILTSLPFQPQAGFWHSCFLIQLCNPSAEFNQHKLVGVRKYLGTFIQY